MKQNQKIASKIVVDEIVEIHAVIKGYVQGVGFRYTAREYAVQMGIVGTVRNMPEGHVEIYASGKRERVQKFLDALSGPQGPGKVMSVHSEEVPLHHYSDFRIIF
jgi:acylphosphatase